MPMIARVIAALRERKADLPIGAFEFSLVSCVTPRQTPCADLCTLQRLPVCTVVIYEDQPTNDFKPLFLMTQVSALWARRLFTGDVTYTIFPLRLPNRD